MTETREIIIAGRYRLLHRLRHGGMSEVFLSIDEQTQQQFALKVVGNNNPDCFKRLKREVDVLRKLSHAHILPVLDYGEWERYAYFVMPYVKHGNLRDLVARGPLNQEEAGNILSQIASALQCAHEHGILHRDIKASNILIDSKQDNIVYLADYGLAKAPGEGSDITQTGNLIGTPEYMAPELVTMPESVSSDIYALGILLYYMLTGKLPFTGTSPLAICWKHAQDAPPPPSSLNPTISPEVEAVILRAIDKQPARRFPDAQSMAEQYKQALEHSRQSSALIVPQPLPPVQVTLSKLAQRSTISAALARGGRYAPVHSVKRKNLLVFAALLWLISSLSLGFVVGHGETQHGAIANSSVHSIDEAVQPIYPVRLYPTVPPTPSASPTPAKTSTYTPTTSHNQPPAPSPHKSHKHHKHGDDAGDN